MSNLLSKARPDVTVEINRYVMSEDGVNGWSFTHMTKCGWDDSGAEAPIFEDDDILQEVNITKLQWYRTRTEGWFREPYAVTARQELVTEGYIVYPWADLDDRLKNFIVHSICPLEWQGPMDRGDVHYSDRVIVWVKF